MKRYTDRILDLCDPPIVKFKAEAEKRLDYTKKILNLNQAVPSYPAPEAVKESLKAELEKSSYSFYTKDEGNDILRKRISEEINRMFKAGIEMENICVTSGANNAFYSMLPVIAGENDEVILLTPYYFNHYMSLKSYGIKPVELPLDISNSLSIPYEMIEKKAGDRTRAVVLVNPSNPTGRSYSMEEIEKLYRICRGKGLYLVSDEVYTHFHDDYPEQGSVLRLPDFKNGKVVCINSFSKTYSITGLRAGFITASGDFITQFVKVQDSNIICASTLAQAAALTGIEKCSEWLEEKIRIMKEKKEYFIKLFRETESVFRIVSAGSFFIYLDYDGEIDSEELCYRLIEKENLVSLPGTCFGAEQKKAIRLALGNIETSDIPLVIEKLSRVRI